jgi:hypothetical protein
MKEITDANLNASAMENINEDKNPDIVLLSCNC